MSGQGNSAPRRAKDFEARVASRLRESADGVDARTRSRLNRARQAALGELSAGPVRGRAPLMAGALAAAAVAAIAVVTWRPVAIAPETLATPGLDAPDLELLMTDESLEMLEDLDFYAWLAVTDVDNGAAG